MAILRVDSRATKNTPKNLGHHVTGMADKLSSAQHQTASFFHPSIHLFVRKTHNEKCKKMTVEQDSQGTCKVR